MPTKSKLKRPSSRILSLPPHPKDFVAAMRDSIAINGVLVPILVDEDHRIIDGVLRKRIADELEYECPEQVVRGLSLDEKRTMARCVNIARRHLTDEERRDIIADQIRESPSRSDRWIARQLGVSHPTVGSVRRQVVNLYHLEKEQVSLRVGLDGKSYPARPMRTLRNPPELRKENDFYKTPKGENDAAVAAVPPSGHIVDFTRELILCHQSDEVLEIVVELATEESFQVLPILDDRRIKLPRFDGHQRSDDGFHL